MDECLGLRAIIGKLGMHVSRKVLLTRHDSHECTNRIRKMCQNIMNHHSCSTNNIIIVN